MNPVEIKISDSARLWAVETGKFKKNLLIMSLFLPIDRTTTPSDMLFPGILLRGCELYPENALMKRRLEELYGARLSVSSGYYGDSILCGYAAEFLSDSALSSDISVLGSVVELMGEVWHRPALDGGGLLRADEVRLAKSSMCDSIRSEINNTASYASNRCREMLCEGEPYGYTVTESEVMAVSASELTERYREVRDSAYITFFYVGSESPDEVARLLAAAFPPPRTPSGMKGPLLIPTPPSIAPEPVRSDVEMPVSQGKLVMGFTCDRVVMNDTREYYAMCLMSDILGGSPTSKLFMRLREEKSLCYFIGTYYENFKGVIYLSAGIETADRGAAEREALLCLEDIRKGNITRAEIDAALLALINNCRQIEDNPYSILTFCLGRMLRGLDCSPDTFIANISSVSADDIIAAAYRVRPKAFYFLAGTAQAEGEDYGEE